MIHSGATPDVTLEERVIALEKWAESITEIVVAAEAEEMSDDNPFEAQHQRMMARRRLERSREQ